jgi:hypothetical protein
MAGFSSPLIGGGGTVTSSSMGASTDNAAVRFDGATGAVLQNSTVIISDTGDVATDGTVNNAKIHAGLNLYAQASLGGF